MSSDAKTFVTTCRRRCDGQKTSLREWRTRPRRAPSESGPPPRPNSYRRHHRELHDRRGLGGRRRVIWTADSVLGYGKARARVLAQWNRERFWELVRAVNTRITASTYEFINTMVGPRLGRRCGAVARQFSRPPVDPRP